MSVLLGLYPTVMILDLTASRLLVAAHLPGYLALFISNVLSVILLTWAVMPVLNKALAFWLLPSGPNPARTNVIGAALVVLCYVVLIAIFGLTLR